MKKNPETGLYEASKFIAATNETIEVTGATREEARKNLKLAVAEYRKAPPVHLTGSFGSPGYEYREDDGKPLWERKEGRVGYTWARKDLAEHLRTERAKDKNTA